MMRGWPFTVSVSRENACRLSLVRVLATFFSSSFTRLASSCDLSESMIESTSWREYHTARFVIVANSRIAVR